MKNLFSGFFLAFISIFLLIPIQSKAQQVSPYSLSPNWRFGVQGGLNFPNGNFPISGAPTTSPTSQNGGATSIETSTSISGKDGLIALYSNTMQVRNSLNAVIKNLVTDGVCGGSSTSGGVIVPDPASPNDTYYLFIGNDVTGGACANNGINYYKFKRNGTGVVTQVISGPTLLIASTEVDESICAGIDSKGNYWICSHAQGASQILVWKITESGISAVDRQTTPQNIQGTTNGTIKISPCQNKIAWAGNSNILVYNWDRETGKIGSLIRQISTNGYQPYVGIEFSPSANNIYYVGLTGNVLAGPLRQAPLPTGTITLIDNANGGASMQLGPDGKIYTTNGDFGTTTNVGVINDPDASGTACNYNHTQISLPSGATLFRGLSNISWLNPEAPVINSTITSCKVNFEHEFLNYFQTAIGVDATSYKWTFGDGGTSTDATPSHTYAANGTYTVTLEFKDATCGHTFTATKEVTVSCGIDPDPDPVCTLNLKANIAPVSDFVLSENDPSIITFDGTGSTGFDNASSTPKKFYWMNGSADTTTAYTKTTSTDLNDKSSLTFQHGTSLPEGTYEIFLVIRQGVCLDTTSITFKVTHSVVPVCNFNLEPEIKTVEEILIDESTPITITLDGTSSVFNPSTNDPEKYYWILGGIDTTAAFSKSATSSLTFAYKGKGGNLPQGEYDIYLVIREGLCMEYTKVHLNVAFFFIPNLVTPNGDLKNDKFYITNIPGRFNVEIFNRWGELVHKQDGYTDGWDLPNTSDGIYFFEVTDTKASKTYKGWVNVVR